MIERLHIVIEHLSLLADDQRNELGQLSVHDVGGAAVRAELICEKIAELKNVVASIDEMMCAK